jgi:hypothetical protein
MQQGDTVVVLDKVPLYGICVRDPHPQRRQGQGPRQPRRVLRVPSAGARDERPLPRHAGPQAGRSTNQLGGPVGGQPFSDRSVRPQALLQVRVVQAVACLPQGAAVSGRAAECLECRMTLPSQSLERRRAASFRYYRRKGHAQVRDRAYGLEPGQYEEILREQSGLCAICREPESATRQDGTPRPLNVDHDHASGAIRGLLCGGCNKTLGNMRDDPARLRAAADYLEAHR